MAFLFNSGLESTSLESTLLESLENPIPSSSLSKDPPQPKLLDDEDENKSTSTRQRNDYKPPIKCYYGDSSAPSLQFFYGNDIPKDGKSCENGLFSYGQQTQMHPISILFKYPYLHPIAIIYSFLFLWFINFRIRIITFIVIAAIQFTIGESLKIHRHCSMETYVDLIQIFAQGIGDILLIPYQWFVCPTEHPLIQFQNTSANRYIFSNCKTILKFSPTFWMRNVTMQFLWAVFEEQYRDASHFKIYRECLKTADNGLIALDWWVDPDTITKGEGKEDEKEPMAEFEDVYKSKTYYKLIEDKYKGIMYEQGDETPILFIFTTYCGDSMSMPVRNMADYFCKRGWRVVCYTKRGCGSPYFEMLPLNNHKVFDLAGMDDAILAVKQVANRFPNAPKVALGFSLGGSQLQDFLITHNKMNKYFIGAIKVDGITVWTELVKFGIRQNLISKVLGEVVHSSYVKSLLTEDDCKSDQAPIDPEKVASWRKIAGDEGYDFDKIASIKSAECEIIEVVKELMCPTVGIKDVEAYLHSVSPDDIERIDIPTLVLNSWNDGFQDPADMPLGIANVNPNIFHCITRLGAHCIRREGILNKDCWQSKVSFEFANAVIASGKGGK